MQKLQDTQTHHSFRLTLSHLSHPTPTGHNLKLSPTLTNGLSHSITLCLSLHRPYNTHTLTNLHTPPNLSQTHHKQTQFILAPVHTDQPRRINPEIKPPNWHDFELNEGKEKEVMIYLNCGRDPGRDRQAQATESTTKPTTTTFPTGKPMLFRASTETHTVSCFNRKPKEKREHREKKGKEKEEWEKNVANEKKKKKFIYSGTGWRKKLFF